MKHLLLAAVAVAALSAVARAEFPCTLSPADLKSLAASPSKLDQAGAEALTPAKQTLLCQTRQFVQQLVLQGGQLHNIGNYSTYYMSPDERQIVDSAVEAFLQIQYTSRGIGVAGAPTGGPAA